MSKLMEERIEKRVYEANLERTVQIAVNLLALGTVSKTDIAKATGFTMEEINKIEQEMSTDPNDE